MNKVGILSRPGRGLFVVRAELSNDPNIFVRSFVKPEKAAESLKKNEFESLVIISDSCGEEQLRFIKEIKEYFPELPLVFVTSHLKSDIREQVCSFKKCIALDLYTEAADILGILKKLMNNEKVYPRAFRRYGASQAASIVNSDEKAISSWLFNLGKSGAQLRVFGNELHAGEIVTFKVFLSEVQREHVVKGVVVWAKKEQHIEFKQSQLIGLEFLTNIVQQVA